MDYEDVRDSILRGLVRLLKPSKEDTLRKPAILEDPGIPHMAPPLPVYVQQAAAAKTIGYIYYKNDTTNFSHFPSSQKPGLMSHFYTGNLY